MFRSAMCILWTSDSVKSIMIIIMLYFSHLINDSLITHTELPPRVMFGMTLGNLPYPILI